MKSLLILNIYLTPDWISAFAALCGVPVAVWGIFKLFIKDKENAQKIKFIEGQLDELKKQTIQFGLQTNLMNDSNELLKKQFQLQTEVFLDVKSREQAKIEFEKYKRKNDIKPRFVFYSSTGSGNNFSVRLLNKGANAENIRIEDVDNVNVTMNTLPLNCNADAGRPLIIEGITRNNFSDMSCRIRIQFSDIDGNKYNQEIIKTNLGYTTENPYDFKTT